MCGISVLIDCSGRPIDLEVIKAMNNIVTYRGPDDGGFFTGNNFAFGHRRLSILDLSQAGSQPMQRNHLCITFNGEIYNYIELREELVNLGYSFNSSTDTEVVLAAYEEWGTNAFSKFNGMWAFAMHDATNNSIIFCRDHFGIKPLYYTKTKKYFLAGSEIKQFTACDEFEPVLNKSVAVNFLVNGLLNHSSDTFFEGVSELRPGHFLSYQLTTHKMETFRWYDLCEASVQVKDDYQVAVGKVRSLFFDSVRIRMRSDVRVGSCLSGGVDSSAIVSVIHKEHIANSDFATVTSCFTDQRFDEQAFSDLVTKRTGFRAEKVYPNLNDLLEEGYLDKMIYQQDQPIAGASHFAEFCVFKKASQAGIIVMQDGQGSDEFLCGYGEFWVAYVKELLRSFRWKTALVMFKKKAFQQSTSLLTELRSFWRTAYFFELVNRIKKYARKPYPWLNQSWNQLAKSNAVNFDYSTVRDLSIAEIQHTSIPYQLHSEDRNSMLFSIESRLPFLDHRLVEYGIGLPTSYKIRNGYTKAVLREAITELPEKIKDRKDKMGFVAPDADWMLANKIQIRKELEGLISSTDIFSEELLYRFDKFAEGRQPYESVFFRVLTFGRFYKIFKMKSK